jgi:single stranded DNA-binding protein
MKSRDINNLCLEGNLAGDCVTKPIGDSVLAKFRLCVSNGEKRTTYIDCEWWNPTRAVDYLKRGKKVFITGRLLENEWEDKDTGKKRQKHFVGVNELELRLNPVRREDSEEEVSENETPALAGGDIKDVPW